MMTLQRPPAELTEAEVDELREALCVGRRRRSFRGANAFAADSRSKGGHLSAYPCPFCSTWHDGRAPAMATVELLARYLRFGSVTPSRVDGGIGA